MADEYTGYLNVTEEIPEDGIPFEFILAAGLTVVAGIVYSVFVKK